MNHAYSFCRQNSRALFVDESLVLVLRPSERQSAEFLRKAASFLRKLRVPVRGFSKVSLLLIDEASRVDDDLYDAVRPMLAVSDGDLWLMSTPYGRRGFFYDTWVNCDPDWLRIEARRRSVRGSSRRF